MNKPVHIHLMKISTSLFSQALLSLIVTASIKYNSMTFNFKEIKLYLNTQFTIHGNPKL